MSGDSTNLFVPGWSPAAFERARARYRASGLYCKVDPSPTTLPDSVTLDDLMIGFYNQGQAGTCWVHCAKEVAEITINSLGYKPFSICRRLVGWEGKQLEGGGNPSNGGNVSDGLTAMTDKGVGIAHEDLCPYTDDRWTLGTKPPQAVFDDAKKSHLVSIVEVNVDPSSADPFVEIKKLIAAGHTSGGSTGGRPVGLGIWWPSGWGPGSGTPIYGPGGFGSYGHALPIVGYAAPGILHQEEVFKILNSWNDVYPDLDESKASKMIGYKKWGSSGKSPFFYVTRSGLLWVIRKGNAELTSVTDATGIDRNIVIPQWSYHDFII